MGLRLCVWSPSNIYQEKWFRFRRWLISSHLFTQTETNRIYLFLFLSSRWRREFIFAIFESDCRTAFSRARKLNAIQTVWAVRHFALFNSRIKFCFMNERRWRVWVWSRSTFQFIHSDRRKCWVLLHPIACPTCIIDLFYLIVHLHLQFTLPSSSSDLAFASNYIGRERSFVYMNNNWNE